MRCRPVQIPESLVIMKSASVLVALIAATVAVAAPIGTSFDARDDAPSVELNDDGLAAANHLAPRGLLSEASL